MNDLISRQAAMDAVADGLKGVFVEYRDVGEILLKNVPSAQPSLDEWCTDCKEYDHERNFCPRFDRVIAEAVKEVRENANDERRGEWDDGRCSQCGFKAMVAPFTISLDTGERTLVLKFCPNCGAKMSKGDEEE